MLSVIEMAILLTWIYNSTGGSLGMVVLFHGISNFSDWAIPVSPVYSGDMRVNLMFALLNLAMAAVIVLVYGKENLSRYPQI